MEKIKGKHVLFDTCVVSAILKLIEKGDLEVFSRFSKIFKELDCIFCVNDLILLEYLRVARNAREKIKIEKYLKNNFFNLPFTHDLVEISKEIYPLYNYCKLVKSKNQVSIPDALNVAYLKKHSGNLYLMTFDNNDYPLEILDREFVGAIDVDTDILTWGIYKFSDDKFENLVAKYKENCKY